MSQSYPQVTAPVAITIPGQTDWSKAQAAIGTPLAVFGSDSRDAGSPRTHILKAFA